MTAPATTHTGTSGHRVNQPIHRGTGLHVTTEINGRPAEDYELEVRQRAYERQRQDCAELLNIRPRTPEPAPSDLIALVRSLPPLPWEKP